MSPNQSRTIRLTSVGLFVFVVLIDAWTKTTFLRQINVSSSVRVIPIVAGLALLWLAVDGVSNHLLAAHPLPLAVLLGGIVGNALDVITRHGVRDWLLVGPWASNLADVSVWVGVIWLIIAIQRSTRQAG